MSVVVVTAFPVPGHRAEVIAAFEAAIARVPGEPGVELYALKGAGLAGLRSALEGKFSGGLPHRSSSRTRPETRRRARYDCSPAGHHRLAGGPKP